MSLDTQILRNDKPLQLKWNWWHVNVMLVAWAKDHKLPAVERLELADKALGDLDNLIKPLVHPDRPEATDSIANAILRFRQDQLDTIWEAIQNEGMWDGYKLNNDYKFHNPQDDETLELKAGDVLWMNIAPGAPQ